ncbi:MAG: YsnF/AvaK domain-containing protein, partial [Chloroflexi bacterium]|nr:YsnF/AvaK domain-containing protein [Chloroflexota bacterium]
FNNAVQLSVAPAGLTHYQAAPMEKTETTGTATPSGEWSGADDDTLTIPLAAEELVAEKQPIVLGKIRVHKGVETVQQNMTVPVYHEEAIVEHIPVDQYDANAPTRPNDLIIPVTEEQIVVEKRTVIKEYIRIRKNIVTQEQHISDTVRREFVELTEQRQGPAELTLLHYDQGDGTTANAAAAPVADTNR